MRKIQSDNQPALSIKVSSCSFVRFSIILGIIFARAGSTQLPHQLSHSMNFNDHPFLPLWERWQIPTSGETNFWETLSSLAGLLRLNALMAEMVRAVRIPMLQPLHPQRVELNWM